MGVLENYKKWKKNELNQKIDKEMMQFFNTNPTEEQLIILDDYTKKIGILLFIAIGLYFLFGVILGLTI